MPSVIRRHDYLYFIPVAATKNIFSLDFAGENVIFMLICD